MHPFILSTVFHWLQFDSKFYKGNVLGRIQLEKCFWENTIRKTIKIGISLQPVHSFWGRRGENPFYMERLVLRSMLEINHRWGRGFINRKTLYFWETHPRCPKDFPRPSLLGPHFTLFDRVEQTSFSQIGCFFWKTSKQALTPLPLDGLMHWNRYQI